MLNKRLKANKSVKKDQVKKQLEKDNKKLVDFIENDNLTTQNDNKAADDAH